jgi:hypothetical protein
MLRSISRQSLKSESSRWKRIYGYLLGSNRIKSLSIVLRDIDDILPHRELTSQQKTELDGIAKGCRNVLEELETILDPDAKTLGGKSRERRLKWDPEIINRFRNRFTLNIALFNVLLGRITR